MRWRVLGSWNRVFVGLGLSVVAFNCQCECCAGNPKICKGRIGKRTQEFFSGRPVDYPEG